jgi:hypothetical protein
MLESEGILRVTIGGKSSREELAGRAGGKSWREELAPMNRNESE